MSSDKKLNMTSQRKVILDELKKVTSHPTADEVYEMVRKILPKISLGTVYRNLEIMSENGTIQKLHICGTQMRFDGNPESHYHVRCIDCGCVDDLVVNQDFELGLCPKELGGYSISGYNIEFYGHCPECRNTENIL